MATLLTYDMLDALGFQSEGEGEKRTWWMPGTQFTLYCRADGMVVAPICGYLIPIYYEEELHMLLKMTGVEKL